MSNRSGTATRRSVLAGLAGVVAGATSFGGCGSGGEAASSTGAGQRGGLLRAGALRSPTDTLNPLTVTGVADFVALYNLYDSLVRLKGDRQEHPVGTQR